ncbi:MAG TPA: hypothetical protein VKA89_03660 [Solirubrobacterales bacterium]|nr:hypothetical protein [Solirubrobacterales bacterium]
MSRRMFIKRLVAAGTSIGAAVSYAHLLAPEAKAASGRDGDGRLHYEPEIQVAIATSRVRDVMQSGKLNVRASSDDPVAFAFKAQLRHKGRLKTIGTKQVTFGAATSNRLVRIPISRFGRSVLASRDTSSVKVVGVATYQQAPLDTRTSKAVATKVILN